MIFTLQIILGVVALVMYYIFLIRVDEKKKGAGYGLAASILLGVGFIIWVLFNPILPVIGMISCFVGLAVISLNYIRDEEGWGYIGANIIAFGILFLLMWGPACRNNNVIPPEPLETKTEIGMNYARLRDQF